VTEVESLAARVRELSQNVDFWNVVMLWGLALAAVAAVVIGISTRLVIVRSRQQSEAQELLSEAKDRKLALDLRDKDLKIAEVNKATEDERVARVRLQERAAWRGVAPTDIAAIGSRLRIHRLHADGRAAVGTIADNEEAVSFSEDIAEVIKSAHWPFIGVVPFGNLGQQRFGLRILTTRDDLTRAAAQSLKRELDALGFNPAYEESDNVFNGGGPGIYVFVQLRPRIVPSKTTHDEQAANPN
jgi:hypothetical protein